MVWMLLFKISISGWQVYGMALHPVWLQSDVCVGATLSFVCEWESVCVHALVSTSLSVPSALLPKAAFTQCAPINVYLGIPETDKSSKFNMILV